MSHLPLYRQYHPPLVFAWVTDPVLTVLSSVLLATLAGGLIRGSIFLVALIESGTLN
jgi:hypothetical protein